MKGCVFSPGHSEHCSRTVPHLKASPCRLTSAPHLPCRSSTGVHLSSQAPVLKLCPCMLVLIPLLSTHHPQPLPAKQNWGSERGLQVDNSLAPQRPTRRRHRVGRNQRNNHQSFSTRLRNLLEVGVVVILFR